MKNIDYENLAFEYQTTGISLTKLAEREEVSRQTLSKKFKELGINIINQQNRCKFNNTIFDVIDTEEKAYWLGFIYADGYIGSTPLEKNKKSVYNFEISLKLSDVNHLKKFKNFVRYEKEVTIDSFRCRIMFANKHFWNTLNNYGCTPRKSLTLQFPNENIFKDKCLVRHFIRGYFDGDGCLTRHVYVNTVSPSVSIIGTNNFLSNIIKYSGIEGNFRHDSRHSEETLILEYNKDNGIKFINYIYNDSNISLDRKYKLYKIFKDGSRSLEQFKELSEGKIGESPTVEDNTEVNLESKESKSPQSVEVET